MSVGGGEGAYIRLVERSWDGCSSSWLFVVALRVKARGWSCLGWSRVVVNRSSKSEMESQEEAGAL